MTTKRANLLEEIQNIEGHSQANEAKIVELKTESDNLYKVIYNKKRSIQDERNAAGQYLAENNVYPLEYLKSDLQLDLSFREDIFFSNVLDYVRENYPDKQFNFKTFACYGSQMHRLAESLPNGSFFSLGEMNKPTFSANIANFYRSYRNDIVSNNHKFSLTSGDIMLHYLMTSYAVPGQRYFLSVPYMTVKGKFIDPEQYLVSGRHFTADEKKEIHNKLGKLTREDFLNTTVETLEICRNMSASDLKQNLFPESYGVAMAIGLVVNKAFAK